jgi:hypothetical protein
MKYVENFKHGVYVYIFSTAHHILASERKSQMSRIIAPALQNDQFVYTIASQMAKHSYLARSSNVSLDVQTERAHSLIRRVLFKCPKNHRQFVNTLRYFHHGYLEVETTIQYLFQMLSELPEELWDITTFIPPEFQVEWYMLLLRNISTRDLKHIAKLSLKRYALDWKTYPLSILEDK